MGQKAGTTDTFSDNLPGIPDNISPSSSGGYWVGFAFVRVSDVLDTLTMLPAIRSVIAKVSLFCIISTPAHNYTSRVLGFVGAKTLP